ncbi:MAG: helix-turn-helix transcriptional regulator [Elusimicrobiota bacterium]|nr:helix-turn-helix transcriptional regulator [Elusimicrobiota bacterium]
MKKAIYTKQYKELISRLKAARLKCGLNQVQVAKSLGTTQSHISKIEAGQRRLDVIQLSEFAKLYKKTLAYFVP